jgi:hypothetical protein
MAKNVANLLPLLAFCCTITSFYSDFPDCIGCAGGVTFLCIDGYCKILKRGADKVSHYFNN